MAYRSIPLPQAHSARSSLSSQNVPAPNAGDRMRAPEYTQISSDQRGGRYSFTVFAIFVRAQRDIQLKL